MRLVFVVLVCAVALAAAGGGASAPVAVEASVLDRTLVCSQDGDIDVMASPKGGSAFATARTVSSGYLGVSSGPVGALNGLVFVRARKEVGVDGRARPQGVYARAGTCFLSRKRVSLSSRGLPGPPVAWAKGYDCTVRGRLVVRVRAVLSSGAGWRRIDSSFFGARTNVVSATLAVRSERTGKPISFATLDTAGRTKLWVAGACA